MPMVARFYKRLWFSSSSCIMKADLCTLNQTRESAVMIRKSPSANPGFLNVTFELPSTVWAEQVALVGEFNNWDKQRDFLIQDRNDAIWRITLELEVGRHYQFRYLVNGVDWHNDWSADAYVPNQQGTDNSVVIT